MTSVGSNFLFERENIAEPCPTRFRPSEPDTSSPTCGVCGRCL